MKKEKKIRGTAIFLKADLLLLPMGTKKESINPFALSFNCPTFTESLLFTGG